MSYNSLDADVVHRLADELADAGVTCWLDVWSLVPGRPWQDDAEKALTEANVIIVAIGGAGVGDWHHEELRAALELRARDPDSRRVIPVLLPGFTQTGQDLPPFLRRLSWVDLRKGMTEVGVARIASGVRGVQPGRGPGATGQDVDADALLNLRGDDMVPLREMKFVLAACARWASNVQNEDGGFPSDNKGSYSCTWASAGMLWSLQYAGTVPSDSSWVRRAATWILDNRNEDGGVPIVARGDPSIVDATAQAICACAPVAVATGSARITTAVGDLVDWLLDHQQHSGGWGYFPSGEKPWTASTVFALLALVTVRATSIDVGRDVLPAVELGHRWLVKARNADAGWGSQAGGQSAAALSGLAAHCLTGLGERTSAAETLDFLYSSQSRSGVWDDAFERPMGRTVIRFGTPYALLGLASCTDPPWTFETRMGYRNVLQHFDKDHFRYAGSAMHTWPTRDCVLALAALRHRFS